MTVKSILAAGAFVGLVAFAPTAGSAAALTSGRTITAADAFARENALTLQQIQYRGRGYYRGGPGYYRGGGPGWGYRPWYRRPYYGTIIGGIALGSIIAVTAYGIAPPRPRPDMCWYWSDRQQSRGYWDYC